MNLNSLKWFACDLDGTLATSVWPRRHVGKPIEKNIAKLQAVAKAGYKIVIHTSRSWEDYAIIENWLIEHDVPFKAIVCGKLLAHRYVDDKAVIADEESWL